MITSIPAFLQISIDYTTPFFNGSMIPNKPKNVKSFSMFSGSDFRFSYYSNDISL